MRYTGTDGTQRSGEVWSGGPLHNTVWILPAGGGAPVVVHATKRTQVDYTPPELPTMRHPTQEEERWAGDVMRAARWWSGRFESLFDQPPDPLPPCPSQVDILRASHIVGVPRRLLKARRAIWASYGRKPLSDKRLRELASE